MQKISPFLWFNGQAGEAVDLYISLVPNSRILHVSRYEGDAAAAMNMPEGTPMVISFELNGQEFQALNGGPLFEFTGAVSFMLHCDDQAEVDRLWDGLTEGGKPGNCGWLQDRFGLWWQVVPRAFEQMMAEGDADQRNRVMAAMMKMTKMEVATLERAYRGE